MKKLLGATAACALTIGLVVAPGAGAVKGGNPHAGTKNVLGTVSVLGTPNPVTSGQGVTVTGNVAASSNCRKFRSVTVQWSPASGSPVTVGTGSNGDYTATLPAPTVTTQTQYTIQATVAVATRTAGGKHKKPKKGRQFTCQPIGPVSSSAITVNP